VADLGQIMISAKKSNGVKNITNNMYKKQIIFIEIDQPFLFCRHLIFDNG
jgi:hypothetical protein